MCYYNSDYNKPKVGIKLLLITKSLVFTSARNLFLISLLFVAINYFNPQLRILILIYHSAYIYHPILKLNFKAVDATKTKNLAYQNQYI